MLDFDTMLIHVGEFGRYQKLLFLFQAPFVMFLTFLAVGPLFMQIFPPQFYCADRFNCSELSHLTSGQKQNLSFPYNQGRVDACFITELNVSFIQEISQGQRRADNDLCKQAANIRTNSQSQACVHVYNGTFWYAQPFDAVAGYKNYKARNSATPAAAHSTIDFTPQHGGRNIGVVHQPRLARYTDEASRNKIPFSKNSNLNQDKIWGNNHNNGWGSNPHIEKTQKPTSKYENPRSKPKFKAVGRENSENANGENNKHEVKEPKNEKSQSLTPWHNNCDKRILSQIHIKNTTRLAFENITMSSQGRTYTRRDGTQEACREISWERMTPGNAARYYPTIITEGNHWCNFERITVASQAIFFLGSIVGAIIFGWSADNWGRVPTLVIANIVGAVGGALSVTTTDFWLYSFYRFITGMSFDNSFTMIYILVLEFCGPSYRTVVANLSIAIFYTLGAVILPWLALYLENWRTFGLAISLPMLLGIVALFVVPESSRWLLSKGKIHQATNILKRFAKFNGKTVDNDIFYEFEKNAQDIYFQLTLEEEDPSLIEAFKTPRLRKNFILLIFIWSSIALVFDGHSRNILNLANEEWNIFWMFTIASLTGFPAIILLIFTLDRFGRRWLCFATMTLSGVCSFIAATVPRNQWTASFIMAIMSRFWINMSLNIGLQYASELLPTVIRAQGVNVIHIMGYVASIASPFIAGIGRTQPVLSLLLLGAVAVFGGILSLFLPETLGEDLPNDLMEAEAFGKHQSFWNCPICSKPKLIEEEKVVEIPESVRLRNSLFRTSTLGESCSSLFSSRGSRLSEIGLNPYPHESSKLMKSVIKR